MSSLPLRRPLWAPGVLDPSKKNTIYMARSFSSLRALPARHVAASRPAVRINDTTIRSISQSVAYRQVNQTPSNQAATTKSPSSTSTSTSNSNPTPPPTSDPVTARAASIVAPTPNHPTTDNIQKTGLADRPLELDISAEEKIDWTRSYHGLSVEPFPKEVADILLAPTDPEDVEIKPDGIVYLPEIKYRRILNRAFGPGGWGLVPRSESIVTPKTVTREYALVCNGRYVETSPKET